MSTSGSRPADRAQGLTGWLVDELGRLLASGTADQQTLLSPDGLVERYGVSRTVVREALRVLQDKGMIDARPGAGTRIRPMALWNLLDRQVVDWRAHGPSRTAQLRDLVELRAAIEPATARLAATRIGTGQADQLARLVSELREAQESNDVRAFTTIDVALHRLLLQASGNSMLVQLAGVVAESLEVREESVRPEDLTPEAVRLHAAVVDAVIAGDPAAAEQAMREVVAEGGRAMEGGDP